ncbi:hypothetical protein Lal_00038687 [Lupinus albus]|nr:hypothetical protein Lal_00038687 [Lupinus albus]
MDLFMFQCLGTEIIINNDDTVDMNYLLVLINQNLRDIYEKESRDQPQHEIGVGFLCLDIETSN